MPKVPWHNADMDSDASVASRLADLMDEFGLESASIECEGVKAAYSRLGPDRGPEQQPVATHSPVAPKAAAAPVATSGTEVGSPTSGIYYSRPSPGAKPFVEVGDTVRAGDVIGIVEAMKVFNEITSTASGTVSEIVAQDGQLVNPGDPLIRLS